MLNRLDNVFHLNECCIKPSKPLSTCPHFYFVTSTKNGSQVAGPRRTYNKREREQLSNGMKGTRQTRFSHHNKKYVCCCQAQSCQGSRLSVTRLDEFGYFLVTNFLTKVVQIFRNSLKLLRKTSIFM